MTDQEADYRPPAGRSPLPWLVLVVVLAVAGYFGWRAWQQQQARDAGPPPLTQAPPPEDRPETPPAAPPAGPQNPVDAIAPADTALPALAQADAAVRDALNGLMGAARVGQWLQVDGFVRRVVATVDNLPREHAAPAVWPVRPMAGRMPLTGEGDLQTLAPENAQRYTAFIAMAESVDSVAGARAYARLYPLFQQAYEELGYPGRYFNDRLITVIDHLLAAPVAEGPLAIRVVEVRGEVPSERPWLRYEYADPRLEALSAGQKLMLRMGSENAQRVKVVLRAWRAQLARMPAAAKPAGQ
ncbi:DUF3014 domain-containing protein [Xenophilus arseniciresistens]|uniref:DUF3014 domain-containing protein n=1 Tax=Xenophilus arseniciresistens TaxID=1283306 RepID=A0AAE3SZZ2_9BURK|nr:DUF3014 domain-containing protein [Xenophilus arseniciresistens]MDA7415762.1 DUF3014 domain-containing protein [Xenophilus arseniciresistens]